MGYVPPSAAELIRKDLEPVLVSLFQLDNTYSAMSQLFREVRTYNGYEQYRNDLYGPPKRDWLPLMGRILIADLIALPIVILWAIFG